MRRILASLAILALVGCNAVSNSDNAAQAQQVPASNVVLMETVHGPVTIELLPQLAPNHAERIKMLSEQGFYDNVPFHRVIDGFMAQTGDPTGTGMGGSTLPDLKAEFSNEPFKRGVVGMARTSDPNSANSQFFIMLADGEFLNGDYTVLGRVIAGMENVDKIKKGGENGKVDDPDRIIRMRVKPD